MNSKEEYIQAQIDILNKFMKAIYKYELTHDYPEGSLSKPILKIFEELQLGLEL